MKSIKIGNDIWRIKRVCKTNSNLVDRTGNITLATTDPNRRIIFVNKDLQGYMLRKVLLHEIMHAVMVSYSLLDDVSRMVKPEYQILMEEFICNLCAEYHDEIDSQINIL